LVGFIILKTLLKVLAITAKTSAVKKTAINGVIIASGLSEINRDQRYKKPKGKIEYKERQDEIKMI
jgi:hypothetical protein